jgi:hypothetical protein
MSSSIMHTYSDNLLKEKNYVLSAELLNDLGKKEHEAFKNEWLRIHLSRHQKKIIQDASIGLKTSSFVGPKGIDFTHHFPGCTITSKEYSKAPQREQYEYTISWETHE